MDPVCHTLVGLGLAEAGLRRRTAMATAALVIGANLPDVDVLSYANGPAAALAFRRGWTHGIPAILLWPFVLTGLLLLRDRWAARRRGPRGRTADARGLLVVSALAVASHPLLDFLNTYGMRWLMPFDGRWFYGDTLFIVDPLVWLLLGTGAFLSRRRWRAGLAGAGRPAIVALSVFAAYAVAMGASNVAGRSIALRALTEDGVAVRELMVAPVPVDPFRRQVVVSTGNAYLMGTLDFLARPMVVMDGARIPRHDGSIAARAAARSRRGSDYLRWARFPFFAVGPDGVCPANHVCIHDARYFRQGWAEVAVPVAGPVSFAPPPSARESQ